MTTVRNICTRALRRLGVIDAIATPAAEDLANARDALNELLQSWVARGVNSLPDQFRLDDEFSMFVPPSEASSETIAAVVDAGAWDAATNTPTLAGGAGTYGAVYKVSVAGTTALDGVASWSVGDYLAFNGALWRKGKSVARHEGAVVALLAVRLSDEYGVSPPETVVRDATIGWRAILSDYVKPPVASFDSALIITGARRNYEALE